MSKLNINRNIFLGKEELERFQDFLVDDTAANVFLGNTTQFGVIQTDFDTDQDFLVQVGTNVGTVKIAIDSKAVTSSKLLISQEAIDNISIPDDSSYYWLKISHVYRRYEEGTVSVDVDGNLVGSDTLFSEILREQSTRVPTKIKFYKESGTLMNTDSYEVLNIKNDLSCTIQGDFIAETDLRYIIIGSIAIGETVTSQAEEGLYKYDSCLIEQIAEETEDTEPETDFVEGEEFYIARVINTAGVITIEDKRQFWEFNISGITDKLSKYPSLWSFTNDQKTSARDKLDVYSKTETEALLNTDELSWTLMERGDNASSTDYDIQIKRVGKVCICQGTFIASGATVDGTVASITETALGGTILTPIYFSTDGYIVKTDNKGLKLKMSASGGVLSIKIDAISDPSDIEYRFNFSFFIDE